MISPPADYQWLQYVPYILIASVVGAVRGPEKLGRKEK